MHISAGQRQRLALARSLLARNQLVFLDEPTNKLDLEGVRSVRQMIAELNREQGATIRADDARDGGGRGAVQRDRAAA